LGDTPARASHALKRWTSALLRAAIGRRLPAFDAVGPGSIMVALPCE